MSGRLEALEAEARRLAAQAAAARQAGEAAEAEDLEMRRRQVEADIAAIEARRQRVRGLPAAGGVYLRLDDATAARLADALAGIGLEGALAELAAALDEARAERTRPWPEAGS